MSKKPFILCVVLFLSLTLIPKNVFAKKDAALLVTSISPQPRSLQAGFYEEISVTFNQPVDRSTITPSSFHAFGKWSGAVKGTYSFSNGDRTVTLTPDTDYSAGEVVMALMSEDVKAADGSSIQQGGYAFTFWIKTLPSPASFTEIQRETVRSTPSGWVQSYGGVGTDFTNDGWLDISIVNERTDDMRVFVNAGDGTGEVASFATPTTAVGNTPSPSEPADFNGDGNADLAVVNIYGPSVSILLGNGDGTFAPQQQIFVGGTPRGIAVLDVDGDGDIDVVNTNSSQGPNGNLSMMLNNGSGVFGSPIYFDGGINGERGLVAADFNNDGRIDLATGSYSSDRIAILLANGDGTFTPQPSQASGGAVWMLNAGDVNGDGNEDVLSVNSFDNNGAVLLGNGAGSLSPPSTVTTDPFSLATDIGDIDGDGDLDWVTSSYSGDWFLFKNDGNGVFTFDQEFIAPDAASCALMMDLDNDRDLDLALIDELEDTLILITNDGVPTSVSLGENAIETNQFSAVAVLLFGLLTVLTAVYFQRRRG